MSHPANKKMTKTNPFFSTPRMTDKKLILNNLTYL